MKRKKASRAVIKELARWLPKTNHPDRVLPGRRKGIDD
jgi:hypothetical protein